MSFEQPFPTLSFGPYRTYITMSVKKTVALDNGDEAVKSYVTGSNKKRRSFNRCFSFMEVSMEPVSSLNDLDSNKFKAEIKRWAKAVVAYARQVSDRFGSSRKSDRYGSSRSSSHA
ncbi:uncharacterized protein LOC111274599 [Durio zibethinus]|uniref:Uncharacterized protein LOC111274599 n=1 Tax=Durio zibethinus TaxID=66656 RepID=A0A6P5WGQ1_DURZI|nr:uncharacterized protein LOC111274599 [Durio zibethinus]